MYASAMLGAPKALKLGPWFEEVGQVGVALGVLAAQRVVVDDVHGHAEFDFRGIRLDIDQIALDGAAAIEVDDGGNVRHIDAGERPVHDAVRIQLAPVCQPNGLHLAPRAALRTVLPLT